MHSRPIFELACLFVSVYLSMTEEKGIQRLLGGDLLGIGEGNVADGDRGNAMMTRRYFWGNDCQFG